MIEPPGAEINCHAISLDDAPSMMLGRVCALVACFMMITKQAQSESPSGGLAGAELP
ncbi:MAG TPA: hypothetical protein VH637_17590 [Streptosporangiaceae bacterium]